MFLKENLILDTLRDEFIVRNFFPDNESNEYVFGKTEEYIRGERFLKLIIKKKRCKEFVACMHDLPSYKHVLEEILKFQEDDTTSPLNGKCKRHIWFVFVFFFILYQNIFYRNTFFNFLNYSC